MLESKLQLYSLRFTMHLTGYILILARKRHASQFAYSSFPSLVLRHLIAVRCTSRRLRCLEELVMVPAGAVLCTSCQWSGRLPHHGILEWQQHSRPAVIQVSSCQLGAHLAS